MSTNKPRMKASVLAAFITGSAVILAAIISGVFLYKAYNPNINNPTPQPSIPSDPGPQPSYADITNQLCMDYQSGDYGTAYNQLFSNNYHQQVDQQRFVNYVNGYHCDIQSQFSSFGSVENINVSLVNHNGGELCQGYGLIYFTNNGWSIDQVSDLDLSQCQF